MQQKRIEWIDRLKGITFFLVILGHTDGILVWGEAHSYIYSFHMPLFLMLTGLTLHIDKIYKMSFLDYGAKLFKRMIVPYLWLNLISMPLRYIFYNVLRGTPMDVKSLLKGILVANTAIKGSPSPATPTYYILLLFFAQIILYFLIKLTKNKFGILFAVSLLLLCIPLCTIRKNFIWHLNVVPVAILFILIGRLLMDIYLKNREKIENTRFWKILLLCIFLVICGFFAWKENGKVSIHLNLYGNNFILFLISSLSTSIALMFLVIRMPRIKFINYVGQNTLFYLGVHVSLLSIVQQIFKDSADKIWFVILETVAVYLILIPVVHFVNKFVPFLNGKPSTESSPFIHLCRYLCVVAAGIVPYFFFLEKFRGGILLATGGMKILSTVLFLMICAVVTVLFDKVFTFMFIKEKIK